MVDTHDNMSFHEWADAYGVPDPDSKRHLYDYRKAYEAGVHPVRFEDIDTGVQEQINERDQYEHEDGDWIWPDDYARQATDSKPTMMVRHDPDGEIDPIKRVPLSDTMVAVLSEPDTEIEDIPEIEIPPLPDDGIPEFDDVEIPSMSDSRAPDLLMEIRELHRRLDILETPSNLDVMVGDGLTMMNTGESLALAADNGPWTPEWSTVGGEVCFGVAFIAGNRVGTDTCAWFRPSTPGSDPYQRPYVYVALSDIEGNVYDPTLRKAGVAVDETPFQITDKNVEKLIKVEWFMGGRPGKEPNVRAGDVVPFHFAGKTGVSSSYLDDMIGTILMAGTGREESDGWNICDGSVATAYTPNADPDTLGSTITLINTKEAFPFGAGTDGTRSSLFSSASVETVISQLPGLSSSSYPATDAFWAWSVGFYKRCN